MYLFFSCLAIKVLFNFSIIQLNNLSYVSFAHESLILTQSVNFKGDKIFSLPYIAYFIVKALIISFKSKSNNLHIYYNKS